MNAQPAQTVYDKIVSHIGKQGGLYSSGYCGIAADWEDRLFNEHQVPKKNHWYIARQCYNDADARDIEQALVKLGCDGGGSGGDSTNVYAYAYLKSSATKP